MTRYIVWVGGTQVNDYYIDTLDEAKETAELYEINGYDDVKIEEINE